MIFLLIIKMAFKFHQRLKNTTVVMFIMKQIKEYLFCSQLLHNSVFIKINYVNI